MYNFFAAVVDAANAVNPPPETFQHFYAASLRASLFSGFLTLTGFLFTVKTFIVIHIKKEIYDTEGYLSRVTSRRLLNKNLSVYGPLQRLSSLLFWSVVVSLVTATSQLTIGLWPEWWAAALCICFAVATIVLLLTDLVIIRRNLTEWFRFLEDSAKKKQDAALAQSATTASVPIGDERPAS